MSSSNCCFLTCIQASQEAGQVVWYSHLFRSFPQVVLIHTVKGFGIVNKAEYWRDVRKNQGKGSGIWLLLNYTNCLPPDPSSFSFLHVLPSTCYILSFDNRHSNRCEVIAPCGLDLHFSNDQLNPAHFNMSRGHLNVFSGGKKSLFGSFAHFLIGLLAFMFLNYVSCLYILNVNLSSDVWIPSIFFQSMGCLFIVLIVLQKLFSLCSSINLVFILLLVF